MPLPVATQLLFTLSYVRWHNGMCLSSKHLEPNNRPILLERTLTIDILTIHVLPDEEITAQTAQCGK